MYISRCYALVMALLVFSLLKGNAAEDFYKLLLEGDYEKCLEVVQGNAEQRRQDPDLAIAELRALVALGKYKEALGRSAENLEKFRRNPEVLLESYEVFQLFGTGSYAMKNIKQTFLNREGIAPWDEGAAAVVAYGELLIASGEDGRAVLKDFLEPAKEADPTERSSYLAIGHLALRHHDKELAAENFSEGRKRFPGDPEFLLGLDLCEVPLPELEKDEENGISSFVDVALKHNPRFPDALMHKAIKLMGARDFVGVREQLARLFKVNAAHTKGHALAAALSFIEDDTVAAVASFAEARKLWESDPVLTAFVGEILASQYRFEEGLIFLKHAANLAPENPDTLYQLGITQLRFGETNEGWQTINRCHEIDPYHVAAFNLMTLRDKIAGYPVKTKSDVSLRMSPEDMAVFGQRALNLAARSKDTLAAKYGLDLTKPVLVEILPKQEDFAIRTLGMPGGESFLGVCFGPLITMTSPRGRLGRANWEAVLWHEMAHTITLDLSRHRIPRWLTEGISVYEERQAREGWGQGMKAGYRASFLEERLTPIEELDKLFAGENIMLGYYQSSMVVQFLAERFGFDSLRLVIAELGKGVAWEKALENHTSPLEALNRDFKLYAQNLAKAYGPDLDWKQLSDEEYKDYRADPVAWVADHPDRYFATMSLAAQYAKEGKWIEAKDLAEKMIEKVPDNREDFNPYEVLAAACRGLEDVEGERAALQKLYALSADRSDAAARLLKLPGADKSDAERMLETDPFQEDAYRILAEKDSRQSDYEALLALEPRDAFRIHYKLALLLRETDPERARRHVLKALEDNPRFKLGLELLVSLKNQK